MVQRFRWKWLSALNPVVEQAAVLLEGNSMRYQSKTSTERIG